MSESRYRDAERRGYLKGWSDALAASESAKRESFWSGFLLAMSSWPLVTVGYLAWKVLS